MNKCRARKKKTDLIDLEVLKLGEKSLAEDEVKLYSPNESTYAIKAVRGHGIALDLVIRPGSTCEESLGENLVCNLKSASEVLSM